MSHIFRSCINGKLTELPTVLTISVRYATKPRWVPMAKSKQFRVIERKQFPLEEQLENRRLYNMYRTQIRATINEIKRSYQASATADDIILKREKDIKDSWDECMRINDEWNAQQAIEREQRDKEVMEKRLANAMKQMERADAKREARQARMDQMLKEQKEISKTFITKETIDAHIEKILNEEPHSFLWAIDVKGRIFEGYNKSPTPGKQLSVHRLVADNAIPESSEMEAQTES